MRNATMWLYKGDGYKTYGPVTRQLTRSCMLDCKLRIAETWNTSSGAKTFEAVSTLTLARSRQGLKRFRLSHSHQAGKAPHSSVTCGEL